MDYLHNNDPLPPNSYIISVFARPREIYSVRSGGSLNNYAFRLTHEVTSRSGENARPGSTAPRVAIRRRRGKFQLASWPTIQLPS